MADANAAANIQECLGVDKARAQQIAEKSLRRFGRMVVEVMRFPLLNKDNITKLVNVEGLEYLEEAINRIKVSLLQQGHFGNWGAFRGNDCFAWLSYAFYNEKTE